MDVNSQTNSEGERSKITASTAVKTVVSSNKTLSKKALVSFFNRCKNKTNDYDAPNEDKDYRASSKKMKSIRPSGKSVCATRIINSRYKADKAKSVIGLLVGLAPKNIET